MTILLLSRKISSPDCARFRPLRQSFLALLGAVSAVQAGDPSWWNARGVQNGAPARDYAAATQGQLKKMAIEAVAELNQRLPGGAGPPLVSLAAQLSATSGNTHDYALVNLGQLKEVVRLFYFRLGDAGYVQQFYQEDSSGNVTLPPLYPWNGVPNDYAVANLGQLKNLFRFDLNDNDSDGLPDAGDADGDGVSNAVEHTNGTDPYDYYRYPGSPQNIPILQLYPATTIGNPFVVEADQIVSQPFEAQVVWPGNHGLTNAPVQFALSFGGGASATVSPSLINPSWNLGISTGANSQGRASAYIKSGPFGGDIDIAADTLTTNNTNYFRVKVIQFQGITKNTTRMSSVANGNEGIRGDWAYDEIQNTDVVNSIFWSWNPSTFTFANRSATGPCSPAPDPHLWTCTGDVNSSPTQLTVTAQLGLSKTVTVDLVDRPITRRFSHYAEGSAAEHCAAQIDNRIVGKNSSHLPLFLDANPASGMYERNLGCWAANIDLTCVPVWNSVSGRSSLLGCLVAPRVVIVADHHAAPVGSTFKFVTATNQVRTATIVGYERLASPALPFFDLSFVVLSEAVESDIHPASVLSSVAHLGVEEWQPNDPLHENRYWGVPLLGLDQDLNALVVEAAYDYESPIPDLRGVTWYNQYPLSGTQRAVLNQEIIGGDSSNPCFLIKDGKPILVAVWTGGGAGTGVSIRRHIATLEAKIAEYRANHVDDGVDENWTLKKEEFSNFQLPP
jgi:hypothetical protein